MMCSGMPADLDRCWRIASRARARRCGVTIAMSSPASWFMQARLADVGWADQHDVEAYRARALPCARARRNRIRERSRRPASLPTASAALHELDVLVGKIQRRFGEHPQLRQPIDAARGSRARTRPLRLRAAARAAVAVAASMRSATPSACARSSLAVEERALGEFAGLGEPCAEVETAAQTFAPAPRDRRAPCSSSTVSPVYAMPAPGNTSASPWSSVSPCAPTKLATGRRREA
mgnify:CR=1 FL=1